MDIKLMIQGTLIAMIGRGRDRLVDMENPKGVLDLKSAYSIAENSGLSPPFAVGWIWKAKTLPKIKTFLWRYAHESIGVKACLVRRGMGDDEICPICKVEVELVMHALRDCGWAKAVWMQLGVYNTNQAF